MYSSDLPWTAEKEYQSLLQCARAVTVQLDMSELDARAPVTPPKQVSAGVASPIGSPSIQCDEARTAVSESLQHGIGADGDQALTAAPESPQPGIDADEEAALAAAACGIGDEWGEQDETLSDLMVLSPAKRRRSKGASPYVLKRSVKYCQAEECVFSRQCPGKPARKLADEEFCVWCSENLLAQALQQADTERHVKQTLSIFKKKDPEVYRLAMEKLEGYSVQNKHLHSRDLCRGTGCVYSMLKPGTKARARAASEFCSWCDGDYLEFAKGSIEGRKRLNQALSAFKTNPEVYDAALAKLGEDFVRASRICCNPDCVFSYNKPGQR